MYALVGMWQWRDVDGELSRQPHQGLTALLRESPGFAGGFWTYERANGKSIGFLLLDSADHAHDLKNAIESHMEGEDSPGLRLEMLRVQEVMTQVEFQQEVQR